MSNFFTLDPGRKTYEYGSRSRICNLRTHNSENRKNWSILSLRKIYLLKRYSSASIRKPFRKRVPIRFDPLATTFKFGKLLSMVPVPRHGIARVLNPRVCEPLDPAP